MRNGHALLLLVIAMLVVGAWMLSPGQAQQGGAALDVVGVVNVAQVFKESKEIQEFTAEFETEMQRIKQEDVARRAALDKKKLALRDFLPDGKAFEEKNAELMHETINYEVWKKESVEGLLLKHRLKTEFFYNKVIACVEKVAQTNGSQVVVYREDFNLKDAQSRDDLAEMIYQRKVLYAAPRCDLTARVVKMINGQ